MKDQKRNVQLANPEEHKTGRNINRSDSDIAPTKEWLASFRMDDRPFTAREAYQQHQMSVPLPAVIPPSAASARSMHLHEFVQEKFIPEYVGLKTSPGQAHFRAMLKYILRPEQMSKSLASNRDKESSKMAANSDWPYLGSLPLSEIGPNQVQRLLAASINSGYSTQTVTHVRNVIRAVFSHACRTGCYQGQNPADLVALPAMMRKQRHRLTLLELKQVMQRMEYPEKYLALFALLTDINVAEMCGLQWKYVNLTNEVQGSEDELIPPRTIAIRNKSYRGEFTAVANNRRRLVPASELLCSTFRELRGRSRFTGAEDFVFASQAGTPVHPENIAARRLKAIGKTLDMPWLSWYVFQRTRNDLNAQFGRRVHQELGTILPVGPLRPEGRPLRSPGAQLIAMVRRD